MIKPILTEKSMNEAKRGNYTFLVPIHMDKFQISKKVGEIFNVHVIRVRTMKTGGELKKTMSGRRRIIGQTKKAIVILKEKEKIDLFDTKKSN